MKKNPKLNKLLKIRKSKGFTIKQMAKLLNISDSMYGYIERGEKRLSYDIAVELGNLFKMSPDELFYEDFEKFFEEENI